MRLAIGDFENGQLTESFHQTGDEVPRATLLELKGQFNQQYREANLRLTTEQLLAAATPDQDLIQAVHALTQIDIALNGLGKFSTEWHQLHHPDDETSYTDLAAKDTETPGHAGYNHGVRELLATRDRLVEYLDARAIAVMPNVTRLVGGFLAAKLLDKAGSLERLAKFPAGTIQLLGAEEALFRFLKKRDNLPPKHGVIVSHPFVQGVPPRRRGAMARRVANAVALAARIDYHSGTDAGDHLTQRLEKQYHAITRS